MCKNLIIFFFDVMGFWCDIYFLFNNIGFDECWGYCIFCKVDILIFYWNKGCVCCIDGVIIIIWLSVIVKGLSFWMVLIVCGLDFLVRVDDS